jgi:hypothetical protein
VGALETGCLVEGPGPFQVLPEAMCLRPGDTCQRLLLRARLIRGFSKAVEWVTVGAMAGRAPAGVRDAVQLMQGGVRAWVQQAARRGKAGLRTASPAVLLSLLCASAFCPLLMVGGVAGAGIAVLSSVGGGFLTQVISDALDRLRQRGEGRTPSQDDLEKEIAQQIQQVLAAGDRRADALRSEIAAVLKEIDAGGTALRAAMEETSERVRGEVIAAIGVLGSDFSELGFLLKDIAQAAAEIQKSLDAQGADVRAIIEQNERQLADIRLVREDLAVIAGRAAAGGLHRICCCFSGAQ